MIRFFCNDSDDEYPKKTRRLEMFSRQRVSIQHFNKWKLLHSGNILANDAYFLVGVFVFWFHFSYRWHSLYTFLFKTKTNYTRSLRIFSWCNGFSVDMSGKIRERESENENKMRSILPAFLFQYSCHTDSPSHFSSSLIPSISRFSFLSPLFLNAPLCSI